MLVPSIILLATLLAQAPEGAAGRQADPAPASATARLSGLDASEAATLIRKLQDLQRRLRAGESVTFELLSGAPASYPMTEVSPRAAFLGLPVERAFSIERIQSSGVPRYRLVLTPDGPGRLLWDVVVSVGHGGEIERVEMLYRPPHPF